MNHSTLGELEQLPGIGPQTAGRIVRYREQNGPYRSVEELKKVGGIGDRTLAKLAPWINVTPNKSEDKLTSEPDRLIRSSPAVTSSPVRSSSKKPSATMERLNVNTASVEELEKLPGIGRVLAQRMIDARNAKPFASVEDLRRVGGIGVKRLEALRDLVSVAD